MIWTGAPAGSYLFLEGYSQTPTAVALFSCTVAADAGQFTVPSYILQALPPGIGSLLMTAMLSTAPTYN